VGPGAGPMATASAVMGCPFRNERGLPNRVARGAGLDWRRPVDGPDTFAWHSFTCYSWLYLAVGPCSPRSPVGQGDHFINRRRDAAPSCCMTRKTAIASLRISVSACRLPRSSDKCPKGPGIGSREDLWFRSHWAGTLRRPLAGPALRRSVRPVRPRISPAVSRSAAH